jgi:DNA-binding Xre family transcriptional regulator
MKRGEKMARTKKVDTWTWFISKYEQQGYKSLNQFAIATGLQKSSLSRYFHKQRQIPSGMMATLCRELEVSPNELMIALGEWK